MSRFLRFALLVSTLSIIPSCSDDTEMADEAGSAVDLTQSRSFNDEEHDGDINGRAAHLGDVIVFELDPAAKGKNPLGDIGIRRHPLVIERTTTLDLCGRRGSHGEGHILRIRNAATGALAAEARNDTCTPTRLEPGRHLVEVEHGKRGEAGPSEVYFVRLHDGGARVTSTRDFTTAVGSDPDRLPAAVPLPVGAPVGTLNTSLCPATDGPSVKAQFIAAGATSKQVSGGPSCTSCILDSLSLTSSTIATVTLERTFVGVMSALAVAHIDLLKMSSVYVGAASLSVGSVAQLELSQVDMRCGALQGAFGGPSIGNVNDVDLAGARLSGSIAAQSFTGGLRLTAASLGAVDPLPPLTIAGNGLDIRLDSAFGNAYFGAAPGLALELRGTINNLVTQSARIAQLTFSDAHLVGLPGTRPAPFIGSAIENIELSGSSGFDNVDLVGLTASLSPIPLVAAPIPVTSCVIAAEGPFAPANFRYFDLTDTFVIGRGTLSFAGVNLTGGRFVRTTFPPGTVFAGATLLGADFTSVDFSQAVLSQAGPPAVAAKFGDPTRPATLERAKFQSANIDGVDFSHTNIRGAVFDGSYGTANFTSAQASISVATATEALKKTSFIGAAPTSSTFANATLLDVDFRAAYLDSAVFTGATLDMSNFGLAYLYAPSTGGNKTLKNAKARGTIWDGADLRGVDLGGASLASFTDDQKIQHATSMVSTILCGAILDGADLSGATLDGAFGDVDGTVDFRDGTIGTCNPVSRVDTKTVNLSAYTTRCPDTTSPIDGVDCSSAQWKVFGLAVPPQACPDPTPQPFKGTCSRNCGCISYNCNFATRRCGPGSGS